MSHISTQLKNYQPVLLNETDPSFSVLILVLLNKDKPDSILLTKRKSYKGRYSSEYCFPGGKKEFSDDSLLKTALRETTEETGITIIYNQIIGQLDDFYNFDKHLIRSYVALEDAEKIQSQLLMTDEVQNYYFLSLQDLKKIHEDHAGIVHSTRSPSYVYLNQGEIIWGLTASLLVHFDNIIHNKNRNIDKLCRLKQ